MLFWWPLPGPQFEHQSLVALFHFLPFWSFLEPRQSLLVPSILSMPWKWSRRNSLQGSPVECVVCFLLEPPWAWVQRRGQRSFGLQVGLVTLLLQALPRAERRFAPVNEQQLSTEGFPWPMRNHWPQLWKGEWRGSAGRRYRKCCGWAKGREADCC